MHTMKPKQLICYPPHMHFVLSPSNPSSSVHHSFVSQNRWNELYRRHDVLQIQKYLSETSSFIIYSTDMLYEPQKVEKLNISEIFV